MARRALSPLAALIALSPNAFAHGFEPARVTLQELGEGVVLVQTERVDASLEPSFEAAITLPPRCVALGAATTTRTPRGTTERYLARCDPRGLAGETLSAALPAGHDLVLTHLRADGHAVTHLLRPSRASITLPRERAHGWTAFRDALRVGVAHVLEGADHLLFLLALALTAQGPRALALTVTGFTLGHALTLSLAHAARVPAAPVEALVAWTLVLAARPLATGGEARPVNVATAALFGLVHGLAIAGALADAGARGITAVAGVNAGVELAQLTAVAAFALAWRVASRLGAGARARRLLGYAVGVPAGAWLVARVVVPWEGP